MKFNDASLVESLTWQMKLADYPRAQNRARINSLLNGDPPYTPQEVQANNIEVNVNFLEGTRLAMDARSQGNTALMKPGNFFSCATDYGPKHKRREYNATVTKKINRIMKQSRVYFESLRSKVASRILHGVSPSTWNDQDRWCTKALGVEDVLVPGNTLLTLDNIPFFALYRSYSGAQMKRFISGPNVDPAWNVPMAERMIEWVDAEAGKLLGTTWPEIWSPEKLQERLKGDGGYYAADTVPTIDCFDFYYWDDSGDVEGWRRRIVLDAYGQPGVGQVDVTPTRGSDRYGETTTRFLYDSGDRVFQNQMSSIVAFQFADLSAVAPFRYHSVRSLGYLLYAVCHLQNRLRCKFNEAVFESLMMYLRVKTMDEAERALKVELISRGFLDETVNFIPPSERWQVNQALAEMGLTENSRIIDQNSSSYVQNTNYSNPNVEKTKFQVSAELNAQTSLISAALLQAYHYDTFECLEIFRRFCKCNSRDPEVRQFRNECLKAGVPEKVLVPEAWDVQAEQLMGAGNKTVELAIAQQLMQWRNLYDPESQRKILHDVTLAVTDDPSRADTLVPEQPNIVTDAVHDAQLSAATLMMGLPVAIKTGMNHVEYVETLLDSMQQVIQKIEQRGGMATEEEIVGLKNVAQHIGQHIQIISQDLNEKQRVKQYGDALGKMMNMVKAYSQRLQEQQQEQSQQGGGIPPETQAKITGDQMIAETKSKNMRESHGQKTAQRQIQFDQKLEQDKQKHQLEMQKQYEQHQLELKKQAEEHRLEMSKEVERIRLEHIQATADLALKQKEASQNKSETPQA